MSDAFAREMCKLAKGKLLPLPKVSLSFNAGGAKSGIGMKAPGTVNPSISTGTFKAVGGKAVAQKVPTASGKNLGNKVSPRSKTVPSPFGGTSQTSVR